MRKGLGWAGWVPCERSPWGPPYPCAARHLCNECHYWGPARQALARPSHPGCNHCWGRGAGSVAGQRGGGDGSALPGPKTQPWVWISAELPSTDSQASGPYHSPSWAQKETRKETHFSIHLLGAKSWYCHIPHQTPSCPHLPSASLLPFSPHS